MTCLDTIERDAKEHNGVLNKTRMEADAIKSARTQFAAALTALGLLHHFNDCTPEQIDSVIEAVWDGVRESMTLQSDEIPF